MEEEILAAQQAPEQPEQPAVQAEPAPPAEPTQREAAAPAAEAPAAQRPEPAPEPEPEPEPEPSIAVVDVQFRPGQKVYYFYPENKTYRTGDHLIIETARGPEYGICVGGNHEVPARELIAPLRCVLRVATAADERTVLENRAKEKRAYEVCLQKIADHKLDMQLVSAECAFDGSKMLFFFTADERVDFRELVKNLASTFHTRIELRQIGVRDKAKMVGGLGICGRPFCCSTFLDDFQPVSIKMAKTQNLSLNPTKISGTCGRLMCCLKYEQDAYEDLLRTSPKAESFVDTPDGRGTVTEVDLLRQRVKVRMEEASDTINIYSNSEIAVLRNGKAKKNDPPIPADWAPISGNGKRPRPQVQEEEPMVLDTIRFRYRCDDVVEEQEQKPAAPQAPQEEQKPPRRRPRKPRPQGEKPAAPAEERKQGSGERRQQPRRERPERAERPERQDRTERPERAERPEKPPRQPRPPRAPAAEGTEGKAPRPEHAEGKAPRQEGAEGERRRRPPRHRPRKPRPQGEGPAPSAPQEH